MTEEIAIEDVRVGFLQAIIGKDEDGFVSICARHNLDNSWSDLIFEYPKDLKKIESFIQKNETSADLYYCPTILNDERRKKDNISVSRVLWADLDECDPRHLKVKPSILVESSPKRYQAYWILSEELHANEAEQLNKNIAYAHEAQGADISGWDLTQLLRIPGTLNFKYHDRPEVRVIDADLTTPIDPDLVRNVYPEVEHKSRTNVSVPFPELLPQADPIEILKDVQAFINPRAWDLFIQEPTLDRSRNLWLLMLMLFECELSPELVFIVCRDAKCNKFENKPQLLWKDVIRARESYKIKKALVAVEESDVEISPVSQNTELGRNLLTDEERDKVKASLDGTFIDNYVKWASTTTDAAPQYHVAGAAIILASLFAGGMSVPTNHGEEKLNLWFMILGDTTTSRKSTSMNLAMKILYEIDEEVLLASDGTSEGLMKSLAVRPGRSSLFQRDEIAGFLSGMTKKDYNSGLMEFLTQIYDGKRVKKILSRSEVDVQDPVLSFFSAGTRNGVYSIMDPYYIESGFAPRFCYIIAESDPSRVRGLGPPTEASTEARRGLIDQLRSLWSLHMNTTEDNPFMFTSKKEIELTPEAWALYNQYITHMTELGLASTNPDHVGPMLVRLSTSGLKLAGLLCISDTWEATEKFTITVKHLKQAFFFVDQWKEYTFDVVENINKSPAEKRLHEVLEYIQKFGAKGVPRKSIMANLKLMAKDAEQILSTLEQRGKVIAEKEARQIRYYGTKSSNPPRRK